MIKLFGQFMTNYRQMDVSLQRLQRSIGWRAQRARRSCAHLLLGPLPEAVCRRIGS